MARAKHLPLLLFSIIIIGGIAFSLPNHTPLAQQTANYVGPDACSTCHGTIYTEWNSSIHPRMIKKLTTTLLASYGLDGPASDPKSAANHSITVGPNFPFTIGGKWKLRFINATADPNDPSKWTVAVWQYIIATGEWKSYHAPPDTPKDWGSSCAQCHVTGFDSSTETFWGTIDQLTASVSCESCHGQASLHIGNPTANKLTIDISAQVCGQCHVRGSFPEYEIGDPASFSYTHGEGPQRHHQQFYDWNMSEHSEELETWLPSDTCLTCKSSDNIFNTDLITYLDVTITKENATNSVTCISCHSGHDLGLWITRPAIEGYPIAWELGSEADYNTVCMQCHTAGGTPETKVKEEWHHAQGELFTGSVHYNSDATCTYCHMPLDTKSAIKWDLHNHTMIVKTQNTYDYSCGSTNNPLSCHGEQLTGNANWATERIQEIQTTVNVTLQEVEEAITQANATIVTANQTVGVNKTAVEEAESFLLQALSYSSFVEADGSLGFHNPTYALSLLNTALDYARKAESTAMQSRITALDTRIDEVEGRIAQLETGAYMYLGGGIAIGFIIGALIIYVLKRKAS